MDIIQILNSLKQVLQNQPLTRAQHQNNDVVLELFNKYFIHKDISEIPSNTMLSYIDYTDNIVAKSLLNYYEHRFFIDSFSYLKEEVSKNNTPS